MDLRLDAEDLAFRDEVRAFLGQALPADLQLAVRREQRLNRDQLARWHRILDDRGWAAPHWPVEWGGTGWSPVRLHIYRDELVGACAPEPLVQNINLAGPLIAAYGTQAQKEFFLQAVRRLDIWFSQGFSEPGAGSDLASLKTKAVRDGADYVVTGQKIWSTDAHVSDWMFCLVRTSGEGKPHQGITFLLLDMRSPGIVVRPIATIDGDHYLSEVFFDEVRVPVVNLLGEEGKAWEYTRAVLANERVGIARVGMTRRRLSRAQSLILAMEHDAPAAQTSELRLRAAAFDVELRALEITSLRALLGDGKGPNPSFLKLKGTELQQTSTELLMDIGGPDAMPRQDEWLHGEPGSQLLGPESSATAAASYFYTRAASIYGGSNEIQRNILARGLLGL